MFIDFFKFLLWLWKWATRQDEKSKHGYGRALFALAMLMILVAIPIYFVGQRILIDMPIEKAPPSQMFEMDAEIQRHLLNIRNDLGANRVAVAEFFLTLQGHIRGFSPTGSYVVNHMVSTPSMPKPEWPLGVRFALGPIPRDPDSFAATLAERCRVEGVLLFPSTELFMEELRAKGVSKSYYAICGFDVRHVMVIYVAIIYFPEQRTLTESELRRSTDDVQAIVAALLKGDS